MDLHGLIRYNGKFPLWLIHEAFRHEDIESYECTRIFRASSPRHLLEVSDQFLAPASLPSGKCPLFLVDSRLGWPQRRPEEKIVHNTGTRTATPLSVSTQPAAITAAQLTACYREFVPVLNQLSSTP